MKYSNTEDTAGIDIRHTRRRLKGAWRSPCTRRALQILARLLVALLLLPGMLTACDSRGSEADLEQERFRFLILLLNNNGDLDDYGACLRAQTAAFSCADNTGNSANRSVYVAALQSAFGVTINAPQDGDAICTGLRDAAFFQRQTPGARVCYHNCSQSYWNSGVSTGQCTAGNYTTYLSGATTGINTCYENCLKDGTVFIY